VSQAAITATLKGYPNFRAPLRWIDRCSVRSARRSTKRLRSPARSLRSSAATSYPGDFTLGYRTCPQPLLPAAVVGSYSDTGTNDPNTGATVTIATSGAAPTSAALSSSGATSAAC